MSDWKGIRLGQGEKIQLYNLKKDFSEEHDVAENHPENIDKIKKIMKSAYIPNESYKIGEVYTANPIWVK